MDDTEKDKLMAKKRSFLFGLQRLKLAKFIGIRKTATELTDAEVDLYIQKSHKVKRVLFLVMVCGFAYVIFMY